MCLHQDYAIFGEKVECNEKGKSDVVYKKDSHRFHMHKVGQSVRFLRFLKNRLMVIVYVDCKFRIVFYLNSPFRFIKIIDTAMLFMYSIGKTVELIHLISLSLLKIQALRYRYPYKP